MTSFDKRLLSKFNCNPPADPDGIKRVAAGSPFTLPQDYVAFLREANGGEGFIGPAAYVILWRLEELLELNKAYQVADYAPGLFLFGSDGGGEGFAFDGRSDGKPIVSVPFVGMDLSLAEPVASDFSGFLEALFKIRD